MCTILGETLFRVIQANLLDDNINMYVLVNTDTHISLYTLSEAWSGVNWAVLMAAQGAFGTEFYDRSARTIVGTMLWMEYIPVIKIGPKGALGSNPSLGQSIETM